FWPGRIVTVFQPHRFTRTVHCRDGFLTAFRNSDLVLLTDIYAAGEEPIEGVNSMKLVQDIRKFASPNQEVLYLGDLSAAKDKVLSLFRDGDLVLCMGAGSITKL